MSDNKESKSMSWADMMELEDLADTLPEASDNNGCQENQRSQSPEQQVQQEPTPPQGRGEGAVQSNNPAPKQKDGNLATDQREKGARQEQNNRTPYQRRDGGPQTPYQRRDGGPQTPYQRREGGPQPHYQREDGGHRTPYQRRDGGYQTTHPRGREGYQGQRGRQEYNHQAPYKPGYQRPPPKLPRDAKEVEKKNKVQEKPDTSETEVVQDQEQIEESERDAYERQIKQLKEELKHLNPNYKAPQDMFYYHVKTKEELLGIIFAQNKKLAALSSDPRPEETPRAEAEAPKQEVDNTTDLQMEALDRQLKEKEEANQEMRKTITELQALVGSLNDQLQNERQRAKILQKEGEELRIVRKDLADQDLKQTEQLQQETLSLEQQVKELQDEVLSKASLVSQNSNQIKELKHLVSTLKFELQSEKLRADALQEERDHFSRRLQKIANDGLRKSQKLETDKISLEQKVKSLQDELRAAEINYNNKRKELTDVIRSQNQELDDKISRERELETELAKTRRQCVVRKHKDLQLSEKIDTENTAVLREVQVLKTEALRKDEEDRVTVQELETKLKEKETSCLELASELKHQEEVSQALQEEVKELQKALKDLNCQEKIEPPLSVNGIQEEREDTGIVQETSEAVQTTPEMVEESPETDDATPEIVQELPSIVDVTPVIIEDSPVAVEATPETVEDSPVVEHSPVVDEVTPALTEVTSEAERVSLWRKFKKSVTPHSRRQYKHLQRRLQSQDQE